MPSTNAITAQIVAHHWPMDCPTCGTPNPAQARFCLNCGSTLTAATATSARREERKVVSVLFADLVGFTARAEQLDPEDVERILRPYHEQLRTDLERFGGVVEKFIGDAVMAIFGAPIAHEDDAERAVRAAIAIRDWAREQDGLELRIGVNSGEALVNLDARPAHGESMVKGDVINTAARLQAAAPINSIIVGEQTYRATASAFEYEPADAVLAKGKSEPVRAWQAVSARFRFGVDVRQRGGADLVGRQYELDTLLDALARSRSAREPQLVTLVAVPGMGKSRLVWELFKRLDAETDFFTWRQGRSLPYGEGISFWALSEIVKSQAGILESDTPQAAADKLNQSLTEILGEETQREWVASHLRPLVGLAAVQELPADRRGEAFTAWRRYLEALAEVRPLILVFEDLHWADDGMLDFIDHVADWSTGVPLLLLGTARPELLARRPGWGGGKSNALTLSLAPLSDEETTKLVHELMARTLLPAETQQALLERAGGNPLYAEEFVRLAQEGRADAKLPETVQAIIAARLDGLAAPEKQLIQQAAVLGKVFWLGGLAEVSATSRWQVEDVLHRLERREFIRRERNSSVAAETEYAFRHALVRDVAYEQLPRAERAERHRRAAQWIESLGRPEDTAEMLAHHYLAAIDYARAAGLPIDDIAEPARAALRAAGDRALALNSFAASDRYFGAALELTDPDSAERPQILFGHASALHATGDSRATAELTDASAELERSGNRERAAEAEVMIAELLWHRGDRVATDAHLVRAEMLISSAGRTVSRARVLSELSRYNMLGDRHGEAIELGREALALARELHLPAVEANALDNIGISRFYQGDVSGMDDVEESLRIALAADSPEAGRSYNNLAVNYMLLGDVERSKRLRELSAATDRRYGRSRLALFAEGFLIIHDYFDGHWDAFIEKAETFATQNREGGRVYADLYHFAFRGVIAVARDEIEAANSLAGQAAAWALEAGEPQMLVPALTNFAFVQFDSGRRDGARRTLEQLFDLVGQTIILFELILPSVFAAELGVEDRLRQFASEGLPESKWKQVLDSAIAGDFAGGAAILSDMGMLPFAARLRLKAGQDLVAAGRRAEADIELRKALEFYRSVGAKRYIGQAEGLLTKAG
jgi:class 3 adenylate cyclase